MSLVTFTFLEPRIDPTAVLVEIPHAGLGLDAEAVATLAAPARALGADADLYVDELYADAPDVGAALIASRLSRYVCDLNRAENDVDPLAVEGGAGRSSPHGFVWRTTTEGRPALLGPITQAEYQRRVERYHRPYHRRIAELLEERRARHGFAILLCAHSMPSRGRDGHDDPGRDRADVVPGTRQRTTAAPAVIDVAERVAERFHFGLAHDEPYRGGHTTVRYGRPAAGIHAIQIELNRKLYMDEPSLAKKPNEVRVVRSFCRALVQEMAGLRQVPMARAGRG
ncbi:MAG TPA: N-formylglutamate amidohydrolase [Polyangiaceae bacterium]|nr:N-formylglutamate amidohydrolase [Polyangiaceae bacterium]